jgi:hypothetical protein
MTALTMNRLWTSPTLRHGMVARQLVVWVDVINAAVVVLRPLVVSMSVITAAATWSAPASTHQNPVGDALSNTFNNVGIANFDPVDLAAAPTGQSICPMLAQPSAPLTSVSSRMANTTGLPPAFVGFVDSLALQMDCLGITTPLGNGDLPFPLQLTGATWPIPGTGAAPPAPFAFPGARSAPPNPFQLPGR